MQYITQVLLAIIAIIPTLLATIHTIRKDNLKNKDELKQSIIDISNRLNAYIAEDEANKTDLRRQRILRFSDEVTESKLHSEEHFNNILEDIDEYEKYCRTHPEYPNTKCLMAIENIKQSYKKRLERNDFLK